MKELGISALGLIVPGLGHMLLGLRKRGLALFLILTAMFLIGVTLHPDADKAGGFYAKYKLNIFRSYEDPNAAFRQTDRGRDMEGPIDAVWRVVFIYGYPFFVGIVDYVAGYLWQGSRFVDAILPYKRTEVPVAVKDIGDCFALLAGLLNLLVILDAYDLALNRRTLEEAAAPGGRGK